MLADDLKNDNGRFYPDTYTAHFDPIYNVKYIVKNESGFNTIPVAVDPVKDTTEFANYTYTTHSPLVTL